MQRLNQEEIAIAREPAHRERQRLSPPAEAPGPAGRVSPEDASLPSDPAAPRPRSAPLVGCRPLPGAQPEGQGRDPDLGFPQHPGRAEPSGEGRTAGGGHAGTGPRCGEGARSPEGREVPGRWAAPRSCVRRGPRPGRPPYGREARTGAKGRRATAGSRRGGCAGPHWAPPIAQAPGRCSKFTWPRGCGGPPPPGPEPAGIEVGDKQPAAARTHRSAPPAPWSRRRRPAPPAPPRTAPRAAAPATPPPARPRPRPRPLPAGGPAERGGAQRRLHQPEPAHRPRLLDWRALRPMGVRQERGVSAPRGGALRRRWLSALVLRPELGDEALT